ncbi:hypothetical protein CEE39_09770 [bacterium (candidate division B38) B3_B38]|nr:MAG: hypothetical protein CEE39_09770 [bacterium (candidate division B38) B3_B38]
MEILVLIAIAIGILVAFFSLFHRHRMQALKSRLEDAYWRESMEDQSLISQLQNTVKELSEENRELSNLLIFLPSFIKQLNLDLYGRKISQILCKIIEHIFNPKQILIFFSSKDRQMLILTAAKGLIKEVNLGYKVAVGEGRIGLVAQKKMTMSDDDFQTQTSLVKKLLQKTSLPFFTSELCAPMISGEETLGVISIGGLTNHFKNEKMILKMIADLGSVAITNTRIFRQREYLANFDGLTRLFNRRYAMFLMGDEIIRAEKRGSPISVCIFDIDNFKHYNESHGHLAGDEVLSTIGQIIRETIREDDIAVRYGGEEFLFILPNTPEKGAYILAERVRENVEKFTFPQEESQPLGKITVSGGIATYPMDGSDSYRLIQEADKRMHQAKQAGRNRIVSGSLIKEKLEKSFAPSPDEKDEPTKPT